MTILQPFIPPGTPSPQPLPAVFRRLASTASTLMLVAFTWHATSGATGFLHASPETTSPSLPGTPSSIMVGTILPVRLQGTLVVKDAHPDQVIEGRIMQDVPLPDREKISMKSPVRGTILSVVRDGDGQGVKVTLQFTQLEDRKVPLTITTSLRAMASYLAVRNAQIPLTGSDVGTPAGWGNTMQIGGDVRFGDGGKVRNNSKEIVGKGVLGGVLVHVNPNPARGCKDMHEDDERLQALWVFSSDACGVYDLKGIQIDHTGTSDPVGQVTLHFDKDDMRLEGGAGILLRVVDKSKP